jgi:phage-related minor tail protein
MLTDLSTVSVGAGSVSVKFRNRLGKIDELKINLKKIWKKVQERTKEIKNSFKHFAELATEEAGKTIVHLGIYAAAFVLVIISLWFSMAYSIASGLSTLASSAVNTLKASFPILSFIVWLFCLLVTLAAGHSKARDAFEVIKKFLEK